VRINLKHLKRNGPLILWAALLTVGLLGLSLIIDSNGQQKLNLPEQEVGSDNSTISKLVINEVMLSNNGAVADTEGESNDWLELYNGNENPVNLKNYGLSDANNETKWFFPDVEIPAKGYLVVYLTGQNRSGLYANFKLSSGGNEVLALKKQNGKVLDAITTSNIKSNYVMARDSEGKWFTTSSVTPGYANTLDGRSAYLASLKGENNGLRISEILVNNQGNLMVNRQMPGFIELTNYSNQAIDLKGYKISDSLNIPFRFDLPDITLQPSAVIVVYLSNYITDSEPYFANFSLNSTTGSAILTNNKGKIIDQIDYSNLGNGLAMQLSNNQYFTTSVVSPGKLNTPEGLNDYHDDLKLPEGLIINEVMSGNYQYMAQNGGTYYDWVELYNNSSEDIKLSDYYLSTNPNMMSMFQLPDVTLAPGDFYIVICSGDTNLSNNSYRHANFTLGKRISLFLIKANNVTDSVFVQDLPPGYSYSRDKNGGYDYTNQPTPKEENNTGVKQIAFTPSLTVQSGVYNDVDQVAVELNANGTIYYTIDGSKPTTRSKVYTGPLLLKRTTVLKAVAFENGKRISEAVTGSYIINEHHTVPVLSLVLDSDDFQTMRRDIYSVPPLEVPTNVELFEQDNSFNIPAGIQLFGGSTRFMSKQSFALKFKNRYGAAKLHYQVFDERDFSQFDTLIVRSGSQDYPTAFMRDILASSLAVDAGLVEAQSHKSVVLYVNGEYYGLYDIREKISEEMIANHYNVPVKGTNIVRIDHDVSYGSARNYNALLDYLREHDLSIQENYEYVKTLLNVENCIDFWITELYTTNNDIVNHRMFQNPQVDNNRWRYITYDFDWAFYNYDRNYYYFMVDPTGMTFNGFDTTIMRSLMENQEFRTRFVEKVSEQLHGVWNEKNVMAKLDSIYQELKPEMARERALWGGSVAGWERDMEDLRNYVRKRQDYFIEHTIEFFDLSKADAQKYFGDL
jgi:hypothetical protein